MANELNRALTMTPEQQERMQLNLYEHVTTKNVQFWISNFLRRLVHVLGSRKKRRVYAASGPLRPVAAVPPRPKAAIHVRLRRNPDAHRAGAERGRPVG